MSILVIVLRVVSMAAFAAPMLLSQGARHGEPQARAHRGASDRAPLVMNLVAFAVFLASLLLFRSSSAGSIALALALSGCGIALAGATLVLRSRAELGSAWSLLPKADRDTGLVTTGPYRFVRHPIYLGLSLLAAGNALCFGSWLAFLVVLVAILPTFAWRAHVEELQLGLIFGDCFADYRKRTKMIIPRIL